jgi:hypothetical protein
MQDNQKIYTIYTVDYKGERTRKGAVLQENKAKAIVKVYEEKEIKAVYEKEDL